MSLRVILNGKKAGLVDVRAAISTLRNDFSKIEVRATREHGDSERLVREAVRDGVPRIVAAGGDGTLNEVVNGLMKLGESERPELAILPLGTANDFSTACSIPPNPLDALRLTILGTPRPVDIVQENDRYIINIASGGFGAQVAADTPVPLKNFLGGGAYTLSAVIKAMNFTHSRGRLEAPDIALEGSAVMGAVCNGRQAGGGQVLAPEAYIDEGFFDVLVILAFPLSDAAQVLKEGLNPSSSGKYVKRFRANWMETRPEQARLVNLDGEPCKTTDIRFDLLPKQVRLVLPDDCPCIKNTA